MNTENNIDHRKVEMMRKAAQVNIVPLSVLDKLIKERYVYANDGRVEEVDIMNKIICNILGIEA
jgi:hypothetical protein